jgi:hypothetical protein
LSPPPYKNLGSLAARRQKKTGAWPVGLAVFVPSLGGEVEFRNPIELLSSRVCVVLQYGREGMFMSVLEVEQL